MGNAMRRALTLWLHACSVMRHDWSPFKQHNWKEGKKTCLGNKFLHASEARKEWKCRISWKRVKPYRKLNLVEKN